MKYRINFQELKIKFIFTIGVNDKACLEPLLGRVPPALGPLVLDPPAQDPLALVGARAPLVGHLALRSTISVNIK